MQNFYIRKKRPDEEISVRKLSAAAQKLFLGKQGSRDKEWKAIQTAGGTEPAVRIHRGAAARKIIQECPERILPSRWHENGRTWAMISKTDCRITKEYNHTTAPNPDGLSKDSTIRISRFSTGQFLLPPPLMCRWHCRYSPVSRPLSGSAASKQRSHKVKRDNDLRGFSHILHRMD